MADVFLSYRNTPERRAYVERLRLVLDAYGLSVWWDYGLEAGKNYEPQIMAELGAAGLVIPLWCEESIRSEWVAKEAQFGFDNAKLLPARLQTVAPPDPFEPVQAQDLVGWDGAVESFQITALAAAICARLGKALTPQADKLRALRALAPLAPMSHAAAGPAQPAQASASAQAWTHIETSLDPRVYDDYIADYPGTAEVTLARRNKRWLADWAGIDQANPQAIVAFRKGLFDSAFEALIRHSERVMDQAQRAVREREEARRRMVGAVWRDRIAGLPEASCPEMVTLPAGRFLMGAPVGEEGSSEIQRPQRDVRINHGLALGRYQVTVDEFAVFVARTGYDTGNSASIHNGKDWEDTPGKGWRDPGFNQNGQHPVCCINWHDAQAYIAWLNSELGLIDEQHEAYRLPSEAEWEYACRAGTTTPFSFGATISTEQANYDGNSVYGSGQKGQFRRGTTPVGSFPCNPFGIHDMHGNLQEWCADVWHENYSSAPEDGSAWLTGGTKHRVFRGGSWLVGPQYIRSASRARTEGAERCAYIGFRLARTV